MRVRLHTGIPAEIPAGMFILSGGTLLAACDGIGIEITDMTPDDLRAFAALITSIADDTENAARSITAMALAKAAPMGSA